MTDAFTFAVSGTGTSGMEAAVANVTAPGARVAGGRDRLLRARLAEIFSDTAPTWRGSRSSGGAPAIRRRSRRRSPAAPADIVAMVHAETSTGVFNPVADVMRIARAHGALTVVDAVTSLGGMPVETGPRGIDVCYSCSQKGLGAPSGPRADRRSPRAPAARGCRRRSFYLDLSLLEDYWVQRKYHHTLSAPLMYALDEALSAVEEEGLEARYARHRAPPRGARGGPRRRSDCRCCRRKGERLWTLNTVRVPDGVDEAAVRRQLLRDFNMEIGAGLGPLAGKIWRVGIMGAGSTLDQRAAVPDRAGARARSGRVPEGRSRRRRGGRRSGDRALTPRARRGRAKPRLRIAGRVVLACWRSASAPPPTPGSRCPTSARCGPRTRRRPRSSSCGRARRRQRARRRDACSAGCRYSRISSNLTRAVLVAEDGTFWQHDGVDYDAAARRRGGQTGARWSSCAARARSPSSWRRTSISRPIAESGAQAPRAADRAPARGGAVEAADPRALPQRDRVGRRDLRRGGRGAAVLPHLGGRAQRRRKRALLAAGIINPRSSIIGHPSTRLRRRQQMILGRLGLARPPPARGREGRACRRRARAAVYPGGAARLAAWRDRPSTCTGGGRAGRMDPRERCARRATSDCN